MAEKNWLCSKKKTYGYQERDEARRATYLDQIRNIKPGDLVYLDESGIDDDAVYPYAWGLKGPRIYGLKPAWKKKRMSIIAALNNGKIKAPFTFYGFCTTAIFETYVEKVLVPELKLGQTVVIDNASFHKSAKIKELIEKAGCKLLFLPPYSPDLNPIEHWWFMIKHHMCLYLKWVERDLEKAATWTFYNVLT